MKSYTIENNLIKVILDNDKVVKISLKYIDTCVEKLNIDREEAILTWLEDEGYLDNLDQLELCDQAKENKSNKVINASAAAPKKKTQKERVAKENPDKEYIITSLENLLKDIVDNINIENKAKIITFSYKDNEYKLDLVQKRKPKA